jgi:hypothetical protein
MAEQGIHYRTGGKLTHAGCEMLSSGKDIEYIVIERIEYKDQENIGGRTEQGVWVAHFAKNQYTNLPMVLNSTNRKRIAKLFPEVKGCINLLKNVAVRLTQEKTRDPQDIGGETWGLRISRIPAKKPAAPKKEKIEVGSDKWEKCIEWIMSGKDVESLRKWYDITKEVEDALLKDASARGEETVEPSQNGTTKTE